jgi:hypothetical protein
MMHFIRLSIIQLYGNEILNGFIHEVPKAINKALVSDTNILEKWNKLTPILHNEWICWVTIVKKNLKLEKSTFNVCEKN